MGNKWAIDYDKPGFCVLCHDTVATFDGFNKDGNPINPVLKANYREASFQLDDRSVMRTAMCLECYESFTPSDTGTIMENVINGWQWEIEHGLGKWKDATKEQRHGYMKRYIDRYITTRMDHTWSNEMDEETTKPLWKNLKAIPWEANQENHGHIPLWAKERDPNQEGEVHQEDQLDQVRDNLREHNGNNN